MMLAEDELAAMRATSRSAMPDRGTVVRIDWPDAELDAETGQYDLGEPDVIYAGAMRLRRTDETTNPKTTGDGISSVMRFSCTVPHDAGPFVIGDVVQVASSADPYITDRSFRVVAAPPGSWQVDQRLVVEEVVDRAS
jgi:hypothetical protein